MYIGLGTAVKPGFLGQPRLPHEFLRRVLLGGQEVAVTGLLLGHPLRRGIGSESGATRTRPAYTGGEGPKPVKDDLKASPCA